MNKLKKYRLFFVIVISLLCIALAGCRHGESIRIINSTKEPLEVIFYPIDAIDTLYSILNENDKIFIMKDEHGKNIVNVPDTVFQNLKKQIYSGYYTQMSDLNDVDNNGITGYNNVKFDSITGRNSFTILPNSKVELAYSKEAGDLCDQFSPICPFVGKLIIKHKQNVIIDVEKEEVKKIFKKKYDLLWVGDATYYLEIKNRDLQGHKKSPKTR